MELLQSMKVFTVLAELGSFTKAAEAMDLGRPQVTLAIQELESKLGVRLFQRTTRKVSLTVEGVAFHEKAEEILANITEATTMFGRKAPAGRLRIDIPAAFAQQPVIDALREFCRVYPDISLTIGVTDRAVDMIAEGVDCTLRLGDPPDSSSVVRKLGTATMVTCASPSYLEALGEPTSYADLPHHHAVQFLSGQTKRTLSWQFNVDGETMTYEPRGAIVVNDSKAYVQCSVSGFGIIQAPGLAVQEHLRTGALVEILASLRPPPRLVSVLFPSKTHLAPQVRAFIDWLIKEYVDLEPEWLQRLG
ncbi:HTH-type transcriptional regulator DmlR [compost metagenome]